MSAHIFASFACVVLLFGPVHCISPYVQHVIKSAIVCISKPFFLSHLDLWRQTIYCGLYGNKVLVCRLVPIVGVTKDKLRFHA